MPNDYSCSAPKTAYHNHTSINVKHQLCDLRHTSAHFFEELHRFSFISALSPRLTRKLDQTCGFCALGRKCAARVSQSSLCAHRATSGSGLRNRTYRSVRADHQSLTRSLAHALTPDFSPRRSPVCACLSPVCVHRTGRRSRRRQVRTRTGRQRAQSQSREADLSGTLGKNCADPEEPAVLSATGGLEMSDPPLRAPRSRSGAGLRSN